MFFEKCPICDSTDFTYYNEGESGFCNQCHVSSTYVLKKMSEINRWRSMKLSTTEIAILVYGGQCKGYRIKDITGLKQKTIEYIKKGCTTSEIVILINAPLYTVEEQLPKWGYTNNYEKPIQKVKKQ
jgi:hypothetical protein